MVTHSPSLHAKQSAGFDQTLAKAGRQLIELAGPPGPGQDPEAPGQGRGRDSRHPEAPMGSARVITATLAGDEPAELRLRGGIGAEARASLEDELFGKRILFTDKDTTGPDRR